MSLSEDERQRSLRLETRLSERSKRASTAKLDSGTAGRRAYVFSLKSGQKDSTIVRKDN